MNTSARTLSLAIKIQFLAFVCLAGLPGLQAAPQQFLSGHLPPVASTLKAVDHLSGTDRLNLAVGLPLRNREALTNLLDQLYDPASPSYHQWLTVDQFTEKFGPTKEDYEAVCTFLQSQGLNITARYSTRGLINVSGAVADIEKAFNLNLMVYPHPEEARTFFAPDSEPSLDLATPVLHISGLDDYQLPRPASLRMNPVKPVAPGAQPLDVTPQAGSGAGGAYQGVDFRAAYAAGVTLTGAGQYVGLLQFDGYYSSDITTYANMTGLTNLPLQNVLLDTKTGVPGANNVEVALDIEMALSMAPGLSGVIVYEGGLGNTILTRMATDNKAKQLSASWTYPTDTTTPQIFLQFAAQGQAYFNASGDSGAYTTSTASPTDSPYITTVGGTTLSTRGPGQAWSSEKAWSWYISGTGTGASSGGISASWPIPTWQQGINMTTNFGSTVRRNIPDVSMVSDNVVVISDNGTQGNVGGDSVATPLWAAFLALANQQAAANGQPPIGFLNPAIYTICKSASYANDFHDITSGNNTNTISPTLFPAVGGYDLCTGWGTPIGKPLINALAPLTNAKVVVGAGATLAVETCTPTNGTINPGEPVIVNFSLQNVGAINTASVVATLQTNAGVQPMSGPQTYGVLTGGGAAVSRSFFFIPSGSCGGTIAPTLQLQEGANNLGTITFNFPLGTSLLALNQNFDGVSVPALPAGWSQTTSGSVFSWVTTNAFRYSTPNSVSVIGSTNPGVSDLISPTISINTTSAQLSFFNSYVTEVNPTNEADAFDGALLEIKIGAGAFTDILASGATFVSGGYNGTIDANTGSTLPGRQAWGGTSGSFLATVINLPASAAGQNIQLKWRMATDIQNGAGATFWYLDNIVIKDGATCCTPIASADLAVSQSVLPTTGLVGQSLTYSVLVTNKGPGPALGMTLTDTLPANSTFIFSSAGGVYSNGTVSCTLPLMVVGAKTNLTILLVPNTDGLFTNTLSALSTVSDPDTNNSVSILVTPVYGPPVITIPPVSQAVAVGSTANFSVGATGTAPLSYQWLLETTNLNGATAAGLQLTNVQSAQSGNYSVTITNLYGSATSDPAFLKVVVAPTINLTSLNVTPTNVAVSLLSVTGLNYTLEYKNSLLDPSWTQLAPAQPGNGLVITLSDTNGALIPSRFYRVNCN